MIKHVSYEMMKWQCNLAGVVTDLQYFTNSMKNPHIFNTVYHHNIIQLWLFLFYTFTIFGPTPLSLFKQKSLHPCKHLNGKWQYNVQALLLLDN